MKLLLIILASAGVAFASAYVVVSNQQAERRQKEVAAAQAKWQEEKASLESALAAAGGHVSAAPVVVGSGAPAKDTRLSPKEILEKLAAIKPAAGAERTHNIRMVVFYLESLTSWQQQALPDIKDFLARNEDVDYTAAPEETADASTNAPADPAGQNNGRGNRGNRQRGGNNNNGGGGNGGGGGNNIWQFRRGGEMRTDFVVPPSMRLGLVDVLRDIGGEEAEKILGSMLATTGRGIEVAYLARVLELMAPGKYRDAAIAAAKELLTNPPEVDGNSRLDDNAKAYLYGVLAMFGDTSFAANAQGMLVGSDGRIDRSALDYLNSTLKEQAVPALYAAYQNSSVSNFQDKATIARDILNYAGNNATANQLLTDIVKNNDLDARVRSFTIAQLAGGGFGPFGSESPTDPQVIASRKAVLQNLMSTTTDPTITQTLTKTIANLDHISNGEDIEPVFGGGRNGGGRRGGFGGGNGGGGNNGN